MLYLCRYFFFSSRRRHTRCALVTGVQTCALPILGEVGGEVGPRAVGLPERPIDVVAEPGRAEQRLRPGFPILGRFALGRLEHSGINEIGRASCRERVCPYV